MNRINGRLKKVLESRLPAETPAAVSVQEVAETVSRSATATQKEVRSAELGVRNEERQPLLAVGVVFRAGFKCGCSAERVFLGAYSGADFKLSLCPVHRMGHAEEKEQAESRQMVAAAAARAWAKAQGGAV